MKNNNEIVKLDAATVKMIRGWLAKGDSIESAAAFMAYTLRVGTFGLHIQKAKTGRLFFVGTVPVALADRVYYAVADIIADLQQIGLTINPAWNESMVMAI